MDRPEAPPAGAGASPAADDPVRPSLFERVAAAAQATEAGRPATIRALRPEIDAPESLLGDPDRLRAYAEALAEHAPVYRLYLVEKIQMVAPAGATIDTGMALLDMGLNSMDATAVITTVEAELGVEIPLKVISEGQSIDGLAAGLAHRAALVAGN